MDISDPGTHGKFLLNERPYLRKINATIYDVQIIVNLIQARVTGEEQASIEKIPPYYQDLSKRPASLNRNLCFSRTMDTGQLGLLNQLYLIVEQFSQFNFTMIGIAEVEESKSDAHCKHLKPVISVETFPITTV